VQNLLLARAEGEGEKMKTCSKCHKTFPLTEKYFGIRKESHDGYRHDCKTCVKKRRDIWYGENRKEQLYKMKEYRKENIAYMLAKKREYNKENRDIMIRKSHIYYEENRVKVLSQMKEHRQKNKEKINQKRRDDYPKYAARIREYTINNREKINKAAAIYCANRRQTDIAYRILYNIRTRICIAIKTTRSHKITGTAKLIGCTIPELRRHLERQFLPGMSWDNWARDGWHIDHIVPCACFDLSVPDQQKECFNYKNLRPMWATDNLKKGAKLECPFQPSLALSL
jgi:hypothetical protein